MAKKIKGEEPKKEEPKQPVPEVSEVSVMGRLQSLKAEVEEKRVVQHRELSLGLASLSESLDQAIRWAKNIEDVLADIEAKAKK